jgi:hypothetical protein
MLTATLTDDEAAPAATAAAPAVTREAVSEAAPAAEADYVFEGFEIEFSERIMLIPLGMGADGSGKG